MLIGLGQLQPPQQAPAPVVNYTPGTAESITDAQANKLLDDPRFATVALWADQPQKVAELEATALMAALEELKAEAVPLARELQRIKQAEDAKRAAIQRMRSEIDALSRQGMGEILALERETGEWIDPFMAGFLDKARKAVSGATQAVIKPVKDAAREFDKAAIRPWSQPLHKGLKIAEKATLRPVKDALREFDKIALRPWTSPIHDVLKKIEKYTVRPAAKEVKKGIAVLDKYVPGWTTLLDVIAPIPLGTIIGALAKSKAGSLISALAGGVVPGMDKVVGDAFDMARSVTDTPIGRSFPLTVAKGTHTFISTKGPFMTKLRATAVEALSGFTLVVQLAAVVATGGALAPAVMALGAMLQGLQAGITVANAHEATQALKKQARAIRSAANLKLAAIEAEERQTLAEIAKIKANIEEIKRRRAALARQAAIRAREAEEPVGPVAQAAESLGVSEEALIVGGLLMIGGVVVIVSMSGE